MLLIFDDGMQLRKRGCNVSNGCGKKITAWKNTQADNDVATSKAGISDHNQGELYGRYFANAINISRWRISYVAKTKVRLKSPKKVVVASV